MGYNPRMVLVHGSYSRTRDIVKATLAVVMVAVGFFIVLFFSSKSISFVATITGAKIAHAEAPTGDSDGGCDGPGDGDDGGDCSGASGASCGDGGDS